MTPDSASSWLTRRVLGWALYDVASSTYIALVPAFFGLYFVALSGPSSTQATGLWGAIAAASLVLAGLLSPIIGAFADRSARWFGVLVAATACCAAAAMLLPLAAHQGMLAMAVVFLAAQVGYTVATTLYDSLVVDIAPAAQRGRVSGLGWSLGLVGGIAATLAALWIMRGVATEAQVARLADLFVLGGALFALLAIPGLAAVRGLRQSPPPAASSAGLIQSVLIVAATLRDWRSHRVTLQVLLAFFLINDVLVTIQFFIVIVMSSRFGLAVDGILAVSLLFHCIAVPSTIACGVLADRWGGRPMIALMCAVLAAAILLLAFGTAVWALNFAVVLLGLVFGSIQAVFRSLYAGLVPLDRAAELFGFNSVAGRLSAAVGPLIFGAVTAMLGSKTWALCALLVPLGAGVALLLATRLTDAAVAEGETSIAAAGLVR